MKETWADETQNYAKLGTLDLLDMNRNGVFLMKVMTVMCTLEIIWAIKKQHCRHFLRNVHDFNPQKILCTKFGVNINPQWVRKRRMFCFVYLVLSFALSEALANGKFCGLSCTKYLSEVCRFRKNYRPGSAMVSQRTQVLHLFNTKKFQLQLLSNSHLITAYLMKARLMSRIEPERMRTGLWKLCSLDLK